MARCSFCGKQIQLGKGITYVETSGRIYHFCSSKCKKNKRMKRDPTKVKWVKKRKD